MVCLLNDMLFICPKKIISTSSMEFFNQRAASNTVLESAYTDLSRPHQTTQGHSSCLLHMIPQAFCSNHTLDSFVIVSA